MCLCEIEPSFLTAVSELKFHLAAVIYGKYLETGLGSRRVPIMTHLSVLGALVAQPRLGEGAVASRSAKSAPPPTHLTRHSTLKLSSCPTNLTEGNRRFAPSNRTFSPQRLCKSHRRASNDDDRLQPWLREESLS